VKKRNVVTQTSGFEAKCEVERTEGGKRRWTERDARETRSQGAMGESTQEGDKSGGVKRLRWWP